MSSLTSELVLVLAPRGRDASIATRMLRDAGLVTLACGSVEQLCREISACAGSALIAVEALSRPGVKQLEETLARQPSWSELPLLVFAAPGLDRAIASLAPLSLRANVTLLDRPIRVKTLISATRSALQARRRQYQLRGLMEELEGRVHERDKFLAILGHELRNPLAAILLASQRAGAESGLDEEHASLIERQARHLTRLVEDLLDLSRVTAGKIMLQRAVVDLKHVVAESLEIVRESAAEQRVKLHLAADASPLLVAGDPVRLEQIVSNLLTNAVKYTPPGGRVVVHVERDGKRAILRVEDTGVGIDPSRLGHIFGLFTQAENAIGRAQGGMGIGLSLVRNLVELHSGSVIARSEGIGKGSEFVVELPLTTAPAPAAPIAPAGLEEAQDPLIIVVVEDNADVRCLLQSKLRRLGHAVDGLGRGEDGVAHIVQHPPDLALIDIGLPDIDGYEVARRVRAALGRRVRLVALSGFGQTEDRVRAIEAGFDEHLAKPADIKDLVALLGRARCAAAP